MVSFYQVEHLFFFLKKNRLSQNTERRKGLTNYISRAEAEELCENLISEFSKTESVPLGELKALASERMLYFDESLMSFTMGNCITLEDTNGNRKLLKKRRDEKIDNVSALMDAYVAYKANKDAFE